jgi:hypothetical protein
MRRTAGTFLVLAALGGCVSGNPRANLGGKSYYNAKPVTVSAAQTALKQQDPAVLPAPDSTANAPVPACGPGGCPPASAARTATPAGPTAPETKPAAATQLPDVPYPVVPATGTQTPPAPVNPTTSSVPGPAQAKSASGRLVAATYTEANRDPAAPADNVGVTPPREVKPVTTAGLAASTAPVVPTDSVRDLTLPGDRTDVPPKDVKPTDVAGASPGCPPPAATGPGASPRGPTVRLVNTKRITLNYEIKDVGPSGISGVELWYTPDTRNWKKHDAPPQFQPPCVIEVNQEGLYGFTLLARSGVGMAQEPPQPGDPPQVWVEVDLTKPAVQLTGVEFVCTPKARTLTVRWTAGDKNISPRPITISHADQPDGPWTVVAANLENTGHHEWPVPASAPRAVYVRVEATDLVGNVGAAQTPNPVLIDQSQPTVSILTVEPNRN